MKLSPKTPALDLTTKYAQKFHHKDFGFITAPNQLKPNWTTNTAYPLSTGELIRLYEDPRELIGVGFGSTTNYLLLDIDYAKSPVHPHYNSELFKQLLNALEKIGIVRYIVLQSSWSKGIHVYIPLPKHYPTYHLAAAVQVTLIDAGFGLGNGKIEIFPNCKPYASKEGEEYSHYKRHRLPLQPESGSYLLENDGLNPQPILNTPAAQIAAFLDQWEMAAAGQDVDLLDKKLPKLYEKFKQQKNQFKYRPTEQQSKKARAWETALDKNIEIGWTSTGQTYKLLPKFLAKAVVFLNLQGEALYNWLYEKIVNAPGYWQYCQHKHEIEKIIKSWIKTNNIKKYYTPYRSEPTRPQPFPFGDPKLVEKQQRQPNPENQKRAETVIKQLTIAVRSVLHKFTPELKIGEWEKTIREQMKKLFDRACSNSTMTKYKTIWHPKYGDIFPTLSKTSEKEPEPRQTDEYSDCPESEKNSDLNSQTETGKDFPQAKSPMICSVIANLPNINTPTPPRSDYETTINDNTPVPSEHTESIVTTGHTPGKFEVLAGVLSKIIGVAAIIVNVGLAAGIGIGVSEPEPAIAVETSSISEVVEINSIPGVETSSKVGRVEIESDTADYTDEKPLPPCLDPRISPMYLIEYNPNQIGVPWTTAGEFYKFLGYLVIVAKQDRTIKNPRAWAITSIKNLKERGINSHWLKFTGQEMFDPNSPIAESLRQRFSPTPTATVNVIIVGGASPVENRPKEPISKIVQRLERQPTKREPISRPPEPTPIATTESGHRHQRSQNSSCPKCEAPTPAVELERWEMCRFCATDILFKRKI
jgi:hypothetical protein